MAKKKRYHVTLDPDLVKAVERPDTSLSIVVSDALRLSLQMPTPLKKQPTPKENVQIYTKEEIDRKLDGLKSLLEPSINSIGDISSQAAFNKEWEDFRKEFENLCKDSKHYYEQMALAFKTERDNVHAKMNNLEDVVNKTVNGMFNEFE